jgi:zinc finger-like protein
MASYYCGICHLWDNNNAHKIYHCPYCNLCRQGQGLGLDSCHCMQCNTCMHLADFPRHQCRKLNPCPICQENLYESTKPYRVRCYPFGSMHALCCAIWRPQTRFMVGCCKIATDC